MKNLTGKDLHELSSDTPVCPDCAARLNREMWFENIKRVNTNGHGGDYKNILHCTECGSVFEFIKPATSKDVQ
tara:strand:- start:113 stop:331 length:219 start_codon:yes stop_codon:yes gene_type:complete